MLLSVCIRVHPWFKAFQPRMHADRAHQQYQPFHAQGLSAGPEDPLGLTKIEDSQAAIVAAALPGCLGRKRPIELRHSG